MKTKKIIVFVIPLISIILCFLFFNRKKESINLLEKKIKQKKIQKEQADNVIKREIFFRANPINPKKWVLTDYNDKKIHGVEIFNNNPILVLYILPNACSPCLENEIKELDDWASSNQNIRGKIIIVTSFFSINEFKAYHSILNINHIDIYNMSQKEGLWPEKYASYFLWKNNHISNIHIPRLSDMELNSHYRDIIFSSMNLEKEDSQVLYIINGKELMKSKSFISEITPTSISEMKILNPEAGKNQYGIKGKNGVFILELKNRK